MKALLVLTLVWLLTQIGAVAIDERRPVSGRPSAHQVEVVLNHWPVAAREVARRMIVTYGLPDRALAHLLWWKEDGAGGIVVYRDSAATPAAAAGAAARSRKTLPSRNL